MKSNPVILGIVLVLLIAAGIWIWRSASREPMSGFKDFPWTYIAEPATGTDPARVIVVRGQINGPASTTDPASGEIAWPAYVHPDAAIVPLVDGKPVIFPIIPNGLYARTPVIPTLKRPLTRQELEGAVRFQTPEGQARMEAFHKEMGQ